MEEIKNSIYLDYLSKLDNIKTGFCESPIFELNLLKKKISESLSPDLQIRFKKLKFYEKISTQDDIPF